VCIDNFNYNNEDDEMSELKKIDMHIGAQKPYNYYNYVNPKIPSTSKNSNQYNQSTPTIENDDSLNLTPQTTKHVKSNNNNYNINQNNKQNNKNGNNQCNKQGNNNDNQNNNQTKYSYIPKPIQSNLMANKENLKASQNSKTSKTSQQNKHSQMSPYTEIVYSKDNEVKDDYYNNNSSKF